MIKLTGTRSLLLLALLVIAPARSHADTPGAASPATSTGVHWHTDLRAAHQLAVQQQRPLLIVVGATWCGPCRRLENETFQHAEMAEYINTYFVPVHLDLDENREIAERLEVEGVPTSVVLSPRGELLGRFSGFAEPVPYYQQLYRAQEVQIRLMQQQSVQPAAGLRQ